MAEQRGVVLRLREWWVAPAVAVGLLVVWVHSLRAREPGEGGVRCPEWINNWRRSQS